MELGYKISKATRWVSLGEDISRMVSRGDGVQPKIAFHEILMSDMAVNFNVLGAFMEDIIMSNINSIAIITIKRSFSELWSIQVSQEPSKPEKLTNDVNKGTILSYSAGMRNNILLFSMP